MTGYRQIFRGLGRFIFLWLYLLTFLGCAILGASAGYNSLPPDERVQYQQLADRMSVEQRIEYLQIHEPQKRQAYLRDNGLLPNQPESEQVNTVALAHSAPLPEERDALFTFGKKVETPPAVAPVKSAPPEYLEYEAQALAKKESVPEKPTSYNEARDSMLEKEAQEVPVEVPIAEKVAEPVVAAPAPEVPEKKITAPEPPSVQYEKTGDPVKDVLALLDLYESGKISKEQFEREKDLAFKK